MFVMLTGGPFPQVCEEPLFVRGTRAHVESCEAGPFLFFVVLHLVQQCTDVGCHGLA